MSGRTPHRQLWVLMATVFVDMLGFLIVLPLLPFYAERMHATPSAIGFLVATFAFAQLVTAPVWGRLSDRYGRRPMILGGLAASAIAFFLFGMAESLWVLFLSRLVQGASGGTTGVVQAYVSDSVAPDQRAAAFGWISAATSTGVVIGPVIASVMTRFGGAAPGFMAAGLCLANLASAWRWLPEPETAGRRRTERPEPGSMRRAMKRVLRHPREQVSSLIWIYALGMMAFLAMNAVLALFLERRFGITDRSIWWVYSYVGVISVTMRTLVIGPVVARFGEARVLRLGALSLALGIGSIPFAANLWALGLALLFVPAGTALLFPSTTSLVSRLLPERETGEGLGVQQTFGGVCRLIGPIWSGAAFEHLGIGTPFWIAGGLMLGVRLFAQGVAQPHRASGAEAPGATVAAGTASIEAAAISSAGPAERGEAERNPR